MSGDSTSSWERLQEIFRAAQLRPPTDRHRFIAAQCAGDEGLRLRVEELLDAAERSAILDRVLTVEPGMRLGSPAEDELIGRHMGPFHIEGRIGEGGMGSVYLAEQRDPIRRRVALKVIKPGMDTREVLARFEAERQALALMNHPGIASVHEAGATPEGRPYFAMEYVPGISITAYCDRKHLGTRERIELFIDVCEAVQHAHQKGVIHRDLKPSNILVTEVGERAVPKVIDFGVAKATHQRLTERTLFTVHGRLIGTPEYMSPEQAEITALDVDTRADIYSLGVILYELLVGRLPHDPTRLRGSGFAEIQRIIREEEPPTPSTRLTRLGEDVAEVLANRRRDLPALLRELRGDLDWIVMKAIDKERSRRYASASELAADLRRYFTDEPVLAGPPSATYRLRKLLRRNRGKVLGAAAVAGALVAGMALSTTLYVQLRRSWDESAQLRSIGRAEQQLRRLERLEARSSALWPPIPERAGGFERWVDEAETLRPLLAVMRARLALLRGPLEDQPYGPEQRARDAWTHALAPLLARLRRRADRLDAGIRKAERLPAESRHDEHFSRWRDERASLGERIDDLSRRVTERRSYSFAEEDVQIEHDLLDDLAQRLALFFDPDPHTGRVARVRAGLRFARSAAQRTISGSAAAAMWKEAIADIAQLPVYRGLRIEPQAGLLPLRRDRRSGLWEFWHVQSGAVPEPNSDSQAESPWLITGETGIVLVLIPAGTYHMGAQPPADGRPLGAANVDPDAQPHESPVHEVRLPAFFISRYEMTQGQWERLTGELPSNYDPYRIFGDKWHSRAHPVEQVSWEDATAALPRFDLLLPTEEEWEYAARAGTSSVWCTGNDKESLRGAANLKDRYCREHGGVPGVYEEWLDDGYVAHAPVGRYRPNAYGLHDVCGNVWEWCSGAYRHYGEETVRPEDEPYAVRRGGGYFDDSVSQSRSANRIITSKDVRNYLNGLRPAREVRDLPR